MRSLRYRSGQARPSPLLHGVTGRLLGTGLLSLTLPVHLESPQFAQVGIMQPCHRLLSQPSWGGTHPHRALRKANLETSRPQAYISRRYETGLRHPVAARSQPTPAQSTTQVMSWCQATFYCSTPLLEGWPSCDKLQETWPQTHENIGAVLYNGG